jgi:hypothetical protein
MKVTIWIYIENLGDGSCAARITDSEESAEKLAENDDERFCDDIYSKTLEFDDNGKLLNPYVKR